MSFFEPHKPVLHQSILVSLCLCCTLSFAQQQQAVGAAQSTTNQAPESQEQRARAAMERSLAAQQTALDHFRESEPDSVKQQRESIRRQAAVVSGLGKVEQAGPGNAQTGAQTQSASAETFYTTPWPGGLPLTAPNIQLVDDTCQAMGTGDVEKLIQASAQKQGLDPELLRSVMRQESGFKPCAVSTAGAMGLMQIMPETADMLHLDDPFNPAKNTEAGAQFLKMMLDRYQGNVPLALSAYNAGPGAVDRAGGVPPISETLQYVTSILRSLSLVY